MKCFMEFMNQYGLSMIHSVALAIFSYVSLEIKKVHKNYINDKTKKEVVSTVCRAVNHLYPDLSGEEKLNKVLINVEQILKDKGIVVNDLELRMYIESSVSSFKDVSNE